MKLSTHLAATALALPLMAARVPPAPLNFLMFCGICLGTVAPDADARGKSPMISAIKEIKKSGRKIGLGSLFAAFAAFLAIPGLAVGYFLEAVVYLLKLEHRGALHTPTTSIIIASIGLIISVFSAEIGVLLIGLAIGWIIHLMLDSLTPTGISWFGHKISGPIVTSSAADTWLGRGLVLIGVATLGFIAMG